MESPRVQAGASAAPLPSIDWWRPAAPAGEARDSVPDVPSAGRAGFRALVAFSVILIAAPQEFVGALKPFRIALVAAAVAIACYALDRMNRRIRARVPKEIWLTLVLVSWAFVMVPFSYWPTGSLSMMGNLYLKSVAVFILLAEMVDTLDRLRTIAWALALCAVPIAAAAILHFRAGDFMSNGPGRIAGYGTSGLAGNPNDLALTLDLIIPLVMALATTSRRLIARAAAALILPLAVAAVIVTFSRGGFLTLVVIATLYLCRLARRGRLALVAAILAAALAAVVFAPAGYGARLRTISNIGSDPTGSAENRWRDTVVATEFVMAHPVLGAGAGMDYLALNELRGPDWLSVHNAYLNYAVDLGLPGLGLFLALVGCCLADAHAAERLAVANAGADDDLARFAAAIRISLWGFTVAAFFHPIAYHPYFYYFAGLAVAVHHIAVRRQHPRVAAGAREAAA